MDQKQLQKKINTTQQDIDEITADLNLWNGFRNGVRISDYQRNKMRPQIRRKYEEKTGSIKKLLNNMLRELETDLESLKKESENLKDTSSDDTAEDKLSGPGNNIIYDKRLVYTFDELKKIVKTKGDGLYGIYLGTVYGTIEVRKKYLTLEIVEDIIKSYEAVTFFNGVYDIKKLDGKNEQLKELDQIDEIEPMDMNPKKVWFKNVDLNKSKINCLQNYLTNEWKQYKSNKKISSQIKKLKTIGDLKEFCTQKQIGCKIFDISTSCIYNQTNHSRKHKFKKLIFLLHDNHIYPIRGSKLEKSTPKFDQHIYSENIYKDVVKKIEEDNKFFEVYARDNVIYAFHVKEENKHICYTTDKGSMKCKKVLREFGLDEFMAISTKFTNLVEMISRFSDDYINLNSYNPNINNHTVSDLNYSNDKLIEKAKNHSIEYTDIDKNKCYLNALMNLDYLITHDIHKHDVVDTKNIVDHYLYAVKCKKNTLTIHQNGFYPGYIIKQVKRSSIEILYGYETEKHKNIYKPILRKIIDMMKKYPDMQDYLKLCVVSFIGSMQSKMNLSRKTKFEGIYDEKQAKTKGKHIITLDDENPKYKAVYNDDTKDKKNKNVYDPYVVKNMSNKMPIAIQIKAEARLILKRKIKELKIPYRDIIQIKTDCIVAKGKYKINPSKEYTGWKYQSNTKFTHFPKTFTEHIPYMYPSINNDNEMNLGYAGCGKTYKIINEEIKKYQDYIVLSPTHSALSEYYKEKINCSTIQKFSNIGRVPKEKVIIIDEIGMVGKKGWNIIKMATLLNKKVICYGDFKQLPPYGSSQQIYHNDKSITIPGKPFYNKRIRSLLFREQTFSTKNHRNNFSNEYYDSVIENKVNIRDEVIKYNTKLDNAQYIVAYRNKTVDKYNDIIRKRLGFEKITDIGSKVICLTNKYVNIEEIGIPKSSIFTIIGSKKMRSLVKKRQKKKIKHMILEDEQKNKYYIPEEDFYKKGSKIQPKNIPIWKNSYALTLHRLQGSTINSYHFAKEDLYIFNICQQDHPELNKFKAKFAYTLISRLKK